MAKKTKKEFSLEEVSKAYEGLELIKAIVRRRNITPLMLGGLFYDARIKKWFKKVGIKRVDFLGDPEVSLNQKTLYAYENNYRAFCKVGGYEIEDLATIDMKKLTTLRPHIFKTRMKKLPELKVSKEVLAEWIERAKTLSTTDFNIEIFQHFKMKGKEEKHDWEKKTKEYWRCKNCGEKCFHDPLKSE